MIINSNAYFFEELPDSLSSIKGWKLFPLLRNSDKLLMFWFPNGNRKSRRKKVFLPIVFSYQHHVTAQSCCFCSLLFVKCLVTMSSLMLLMESFVRWGLALSWPFFLQIDINRESPFLLMIWGRLTRVSAKAAVSTPRASAFFVFSLSVVAKF